MIQKGDKAWVTKRDGADKAGWVVYYGKCDCGCGGFYFNPPCGTETTAEELADAIWDAHWITSYCGDDGGFRKDVSMPNYLCMAEQLIATREMPGL